MSPLTSVMEVKGLFDVLLFCARLFYITEINFTKCATDDIIQE